MNEVIISRNDVHTNVESVRYRLHTGDPRVGTPELPFHYDDPAAAIDAARECEERGYSSRVSWEREVRETRSFWPPEIFTDTNHLT